MVWAPWLFKIVVAAIKIYQSTHTHLLCPFVYFALAVKAWKKVVSFMISFLMSKLSWTDMSWSITEKKERWVRPLFFSLHIPMGKLSVKNLKILQWETFFLNVGIVIKKIKIFRCIKFWIFGVNIHCNLEK